MPGLDQLARDAFTPAAGRHRGGPSGGRQELRRDARTGGPHRVRARGGLPRLSERDTTTCISSVSACAAALQLVASSRSTARRVQRDKRVAARQRLFCTPIMRPGPGPPQVGALIGELNELLAAGGDATPAAILPRLTEPSRAVRPSRRRRRQGLKGAALSGCAVACHNGSQLVTPAHCP